MAGYKFGNPEDEKRFREFLSPTMVDQNIRQAIQFCWMSLPTARRNPDELENEIRRLVERAIRDFREDHHRFLDDA